RALRSVPAERLADLPCDLDHLGTLGALSRAALALRELEYAEALYALLLPYPDHFAVHLSFFCDGAVRSVLGAIAVALGRPAGAEAAIKNPATFYCQFLRVARFEAIEAAVAVVQAGRRSESIRVSLVQGGKPVLEGLLRTALPGDGIEHEAYTAPEVPAPETL